MRIARAIFIIAAVYGFAALIPGLLDEPVTDNAYLAQPEYYYGFYGSALVWQIAFLVIAADPLRYRTLMLVAVLEKLAFFLPCMLLWNAGRLAGGSGPFIGGLIDGLFMLLFLAAWWFTARADARQDGASPLASASNPS